MTTLVKDLTTGKDNQTHDIARVIILVNAVMLVPILILGVAGISSLSSSAMTVSFGTALTGATVYWICTP